MFKQELNSNNDKFSLVVTIKTNEQKNFRVWAEDLGKKYSKYADRVVSVKGERKIFFSFPISPKKLFFACVNKDNIEDSDYTVTILRAELKELKEDYARMIIKSYKSNTEQSKIMFFMSSENFLQAYKRLQYMKQYAKQRQQQGERIKEKTKI